MPCGPGYITPLFDTTSAPETPYADFAAGRLGVVKPTFRRAVLYAAYRYIAGGGMSRPEQDAMVEVWSADIDNRDFHDNSVDEAVKAWVDKRKEFLAKDEPLPDIYTARDYGGYVFFPNCTKNAFETAAETLADRAAAHGPNDRNLQNWIKGQDQVFQNCASGKRMPEPAAPDAPEWLQKDRAYQTAAASFYSLDYNDAKRRFGEIAQDTESPWAETADYLVARTLIRQASLSKSPEASAPLYEEAELHLQRFVSRTGKFYPSSEKLLGLIKYRIHPRERVSELARRLTYQAGNDNFRQDVIDYNWLLDKFASEILTAEEKRKETEKNANSSENTKPARPDNPSNPSNDKKTLDEVGIRLYTNETSYLFYIPADATDDEAIAAAQRVLGQPLNDQQKNQVRSLRQSAYAGRFTANRQSDYEGGYYGEEKLTPALVPDFLRQDDLSDWLFTYQMSGNEAYLYSLKKFREGGSELWLMTALSKAEKNSSGIARILEAANSASRTSPASPTILYHMARLLLAQGKSGEARVLIDEMINSGDILPLSSRNAFIALRLSLAETLDDFLKYSLKKPYAFDFDGEVSSIDEIIAEQKSYYNPEYNKDGRETFEAEVDEQYKEQRLWQDRLMFDADTIDLFNQHFSTASLIQVAKSPALPDYMRKRFVIAIWTRAFLLDNMATLLTVTPELAECYPEFEPLLTKITTAKTQAAMDNAALYFVLKNPILSPYLDEGMGKDNNEQDEWSVDDWWCEPYDQEYDAASGAEIPKAPPARPAFVTVEQSKTAQAERRRLKETGDAPKFLAEKVIGWSRLSPVDRRVPEAIYLMIKANGWTKYGCGNNEELRSQMTAYLKKRYPSSQWTAKLKADEREN
jgi:hypothetical protein